MIDSPKELKKYSVSKNGRDIETEEVLAQSHLDDNSNDDIEYSLGKLRIFIIGAIMAGAMLIFVSRVFYLQIIMGNSYQKEAVNNRIRRVPIEAPRGIIFSSDGHQLVWNNSVFDLAVNPSLFPQDSDKRQEIANNILNSLKYDDRENFKSSALDLILNFNKNKLSPVVYKNIPRDLVLSMETAPEKFLGLEVFQGMARSYPDGEIISHILGYVGSVTKDDLKNSDYLPSESIGKSGIEMQYEQILRGISGTQLVEVDSKGNSSKYLASREPVNGSNLVLSINFRLQKILFNALSKKAEEAEVKRASAIALNPKNGEVLAMVSLPSFDNNIFFGNVSRKKYNELIFNENKPLFNRAISGEYPPGSTIKPVIALGALEEKVITDKTVIQDNGVIKIVNQYNPNIIYTYYGWKRAGLGPMNVYSAIAQSSDIFFYTIGGGNGGIKGLGISALANYFYKFNLGNVSGIDLPGESKGLVPTPDWKKRVKKESWYLGDTYHTSIGQGDLLVTPLQVAMWTATIANDGVAMKPHIARDVPLKVEFALDADKKNIAIIKKAMRQSVIDGSASALANLPVQVAGKTGTAETGIKEITHAWFTCFAPYKNPDIVITVLLENGGGGAAVAVPVVQETLENWF